MSLTSTSRGLTPNPAEDELRSVITEALAQLDAAGGDPRAPARAVAAIAAAAPRWLTGRLDADYFAQDIIGEVEEWHEERGTLGHTPDSYGSIGEAIRAAIAANTTEG